jgi:hypothetical protein
MRRRRGWKLDPVGHADRASNHNRNHNADAVIRPDRPERLNGIYLSDERSVIELRRAFRRRLRQRSNASHERPSREPACGEHTNGIARGYV